VAIVLDQLEQGLVGGSDNTRRPREDLPQGIVLEHATFENDPPILATIGEMTLEIERVDGEYVAVEPMTGLYGEGDDEITATMNLLRALDLARRTWQEHDGPLAPEIAAQLEYLERNLWP
jgi:hypothetical protein